jgi:hypothetical protein
MDTEKRKITFTLRNNIICDLPLDAYEPGDIQETKKILSGELGCRPDEIEITIIGTRDSRMDQTGTLRISLIDGKALKEFLKSKS